ncbi:unnamed protein product [Chironomus riparius]|uniref:Uncharacterized protein n=1 Tax=Chironomus riparius TaxID=315576 RepID=A0A9N9WRI6_9DIPT|nr:unnamed protein product [Chironomus riparius]
MRCLTTKEFIMISFSGSMDEHMQTFSETCE